MCLSEAILFDVAFNSFAQLKNNCMNITKANQLLKACDVIYRSSHETNLTDVLTDETIVESINVVSSFLCIENKLETIVLSYFVHGGLMECGQTMESVVAHFAGDITCYAEIVQVIDNLLKNRLMMSKQFIRKRSQTTRRVLHAHPRLLEAIIHADAQLLKAPKAESFLSFLEEITSLISSRKKDDIDSYSLFREVETIVHHNIDLAQIKSITHYKLPIEEETIFWGFCAEVINRNKQAIELDSLLEEIFDEPGDHYVYRKKLRNKTLKIMECELVERANKDNGFAHTLQLTKEASNIVYAGNANTKTEFEPTICKVVKYNEFEQEELFYNEKEWEQLQFVEKFIEQNEYNRITHALKEKGLNKGLTILLHGYAGTGKTATVKQWAKATKRNILMVEADKIKSPWIGESEQNLQQVFAEYEEACNYYEHKPILLFNEADAILGKRMEASRGVEQMLNAMQNILLQRLEDFEGIFIATTNLVKHLDLAFDRRFLYKVEFQKPNKLVRSQILKKAFEQLNEEEILTIANKHELTGGQIMNIRKKLLVKQLLLNIAVTKTTIEQLCIEELSLRSNEQTRVIGFKAA